MQNKLKIYLAAPLFTQSERIWNKLLAEHLTSIIPNASVILPQVRALNYIDGAKVDFAGIVHDCIENLEQVDIIVAVLDGSDADSGTCWECGYSYAKRKTVIAVRTDVRGSEDEGLNAMLRRTVEQVIYYPATNEDIAGLAQEISCALLKVQQRQSDPFAETN